MENKKIEVPLELDAAILQYAAGKKFVQFHWYRTVPAKAAAVLLLGIGLSAVYFSALREEKTGDLPLAENVQYENIDWNEFEYKLEFVDAEILAEAKYLAQL